MAGVSFGSDRKPLKLNELVAFGRNVAKATWEGRQFDANRPIEQAPSWFHEGQLDAWEFDAPDQVICAGTNGGKTAYQAPWLLREIQRCLPIAAQLGYANFLYVGPTLTLLEAQAIPAFRAVFEDEYKLGRYVAGKKPKFYFSEEGLQRVWGRTDIPCTVHFAYARSSSNLESMTALAGVWDECGQPENKVESYWAYNRRLKLARSRGYGRRLWGTTPYKWNWFKREIHDRAESGEAGFQMLRFDSWMNPMVSEEECRAELDRGMPLWQWLMMYRGQYTRPKGVIYDCFDRLNVCPPFAIPKEWPVWLGVDFGNINTAAVWVAEEMRAVKVEGEPDRQEPTGRLIVCREYKHPGDDVKDHAQRMLDGEVISRQGVGGSHQESGWRQSFRGHGIGLADPLPNVRDVEVGISCVYGAVKRNELVVFETCTGVLGQFDRYSRKLGADGEPTKEIDQKAIYHYMDALRYIVSKLRPPKKRRIELTLY